MEAPTEAHALLALPSPLASPALCDVVAWSGTLLSPPRARAPGAAGARAAGPPARALRGRAAREAAARAEGEGGPSTSEASAAAERSYCLVVVGEDGRSPRLCPEAEAEAPAAALAHLLATGGFLPAPPPAAPAAAAAPKREKPPAGKPAARSALPTYRKGGPCDHCRCTGA